MGYEKRGNYEGKRILTHLQENGKWHKLLNYACKNACPKDINKGLDIHLRSDSVHIYYKGGRILEIKTDVLNLDSSYFYRREANDNIPRTHMELLRDGNCKELKRRHMSYPGWTREKASAVFDALEKSRDELFGINGSDTKSQYLAFAKSELNLERYFESAMNIMDGWSESLKDKTSHKERMLQQKISLLNRDKDESDFIVIDIEFSVSDAVDCPFKSSKFTHPRFDIIAYQPKKNNRLAVIELKKGLGAVGWTDDGYFDSDTKSGVLDHLDKFNATVGNNNNYKAFIEEMQGILDMKINLGILPKDLAATICTEKPEFMLAYAGEKMNQFSNACKRAGLNCLCIEDEGHPILKE